MIIWTADKEGKGEEEEGSEGLVIVLPTDSHEGDSPCLTLTLLVCVQE